MHLVQIENPKNAADDAYNLSAELCDFYKDQNGDTFLVSFVDDNYDLKYLSDSDITKKFLRQLFFECYNSTIKNAAVQTAYETIAANADSCADLMPVYTRVGTHENMIYYDLCNSDGEIIAISDTGCTKLLSNEVKEMFFRRNDMMQKQVEPIQNEKYSLLDFIDDSFNVSEDLKLLLAVYICVAFVPLIDHPILIVEGEKGAGKTTCLKHIGKIINPTKKDILALPSKQSDLITSLNNNYFAPYDNIGKISDEFANVFCQASTGGTMTRRKLFTDNTEFPIDFKRLVALNGIDMGIAQSDLLDRAILIRLERFDKNGFLPLSLIEKRFNKHLPYALGDIFSLLSKALKKLPTITLNHYGRMGDFTLYGYAVAEAIKEGYGEKFLNEYRNNQKLSTNAVIEENPLLEAIEFFAEKNTYWRGSATDLLKQLNQSLKDKYGGINYSLIREKPNAMSRKLKTYTHELKEMGIDVKIARSKDRYIEIRKIDASVPTKPTMPTTKTDLNTKTRKSLLEDDD